MLGDLIGLTMGKLHLDGTHMLVHESVMGQQDV